MFIRFTHLRGLVCSGLLALATAATLSLTAAAHGSFLTTWSSAYPTSTSDNNVINGTGQSCALCHFSATGGANWNGYGWKMRANIQAGQSLTNAILNSTSFNSDSDPTGTSNLLEIQSNTQPGWTPGPNNVRYTTSGTVTGLSPAVGIQGLLDPCGVAVTYCTAGTTTSGCNASIAAVGSPSASGATTFSVLISNVEGAKQGLIFYGQGRSVSPWGTGSSFLCVKSPTQRTPVTNSGGTAGQCNGSLSVDMNAFWAANPTALATPLAAGTVLDFQGWFRDPPSPKSTHLSNALEIVVCP
ncbi:MAG: hypothetical protein NTV21_13880 [Planctomycetota bacterium]|nr:hypothetical protein [Planctomycetota bacterium]